MKVKTITVDGKTYAMLDDKGMPIYVHDDGKESGFDAPGTVATISRLNGEAKGHRERAEAAEGKLKPFEGLDAEKARAALETVGKLDQKKLLEAGQVDAAIAAALKPVQEQLLAQTTRGDKAETALSEALIGGAFKGSKFITDKVAVPPHLLQNTFGKNFKVEDGKVVPYGPDGNKVFSRVKPGEVAEFDEALEIFVNADPYKESILKSTAGGGGGSPPNNGKPGSKTINRKDFDGMDAATRQAKMKEGFTVVD